MRPRRHHFVPKFYLAGFTESGTKDGDLHVIDLQRNTTWRSTPEGSGHERDFYMPDDPDTADPTLAEGLLAQLEDRMAPVFHRMRRGELPTSSRDLQWLMVFVAFMHVRVPAVRDLVNSIAVEKLRGLLLESISTDESLAEFCAGAGVTTLAEQHELRDFAKSDDYTLSVGNSWFVGQMWKAAISFVPSLLSRKWAIMTAETDNTALICSDRPVTIFPGDPAQMKPPPGTWRPKMIVLPLDGRHVLSSHSEGPTRKQTLTAYDVAWVNTNTMAGASQLYCGRKDFLWCDRAGHVVDAAHLARLMSETRRQQKSGA